MIRLVFDGLPVSANAERKGWYGASRKRGRYKRDVGVSVLAAGLGDLEPLGSRDEPLRVEIVYVFGPRRRASDTASNREKVLLDALVSAGILSDDRWVRQMEVASIPGPEDRTYVKVFPITALTEADVIRWYEAPASGGAI